MEEAVFFWNTVKTLIKKNHITQETLCSQCNFPLSTFKHWIFKSIFPDALQSYKIAKALNTSVEYLLTGEEPKLDPALSELSELKQRIKELADSIK
jgi:transcriptional regulator with XRE-family HTH domain